LSPNFFVNFIDFFSIWIKKIVKIYIYKFGSL
jgi:hypothetical protein